MSTKRVEVLLLAIPVSLWLVACGESTLGGAPACRTYAAAYTHFNSFQGVPFDVTCTHAEGAGFDRTCVGEVDRVEHWASKSDFIDEAAAVGSIHVATITYPGSDTTVTYEYDSERRLQRFASPNGVDETFDAWDAQRRPLHRLTHGGACPGADITISYGDRTITSDVPAELPCAQHTVQTFDADGIPTRTDHRDGTYETYTTSSRSTVCR